MVPQWDYNYSILTSNLYDYYLKLLSPYEAYDLGKKVTEVLTPLGRSFYVVFFPSIERKNILLHCALGHEIGHLKAREYLTDREQGVLQAIRDKIIPIVEAEIKEKYSDVPPLMQQSIYQRLAQSKIERATHAWRRGLEELLSDTVGTILFGPALLFSIFEITNQDLTGLDKIPGTDNNFYPSWRMRLRNILEALRTFGFYPLPSDEGLEPVKDVINAVNQRFKVIEDIVKDTKDKTSISEDSILKIAYDEIECDVSKARDYYKNDSEKLFGKTFNLYKDLPDLINRISFEIPPNACEKSTDDRRPSKIIEILNAAWFSRLAWEDRLFSRDGQFNDKLCEKRDIMNRLTLKALEYSDIEVDFLNALSNGKE